MATSTSPVNPGTQRTDNWQLAPWLTFLGFGIFIVYATIRAFMNSHFTGMPDDQYLSPMYSPYIPEILHFLGIRVPFLEVENPSAPLGLGWIISPALLILWAPAGFRTTCYYYRKAYYRSFFGAPAACAVGSKNGDPLFGLLNATLGNLLGKGRRYVGETAFPLILQNSHRFFFYIAAGFILILTWDAIAACFMAEWAGIRIGLGTLILGANALLLALYTFGCHSYRHILGGGLDCFSCSAISNARHHAWERQSKLNEKHMEFAWLSLFTVGFADLYIFLVSKGIWVDPHVSWTWAQILGFFGL